MRFGLDPGVVDPRNLTGTGISAGNRLRDLEDGHLLGELIEDPKLAPIRRVLTADPDALNRVHDVDEAAYLPALTVDGQWQAEDSLNDHPVEHGPEDSVVVEPSRKEGVE